MANKTIMEEKGKVVNEISESIKDSATAVWFEYHGLTVTEMTELRRLLRESDSELKIYKNSLTRRALNGLDYNLDEELVGPKAVVFGKDAVAPIKILSDFAKTHKALEIKVGIVEGEITDNDGLKGLASIPSREGLLTMLAGGLIGVVKDLSISLDLYSQDLEKVEEN